MKVKDAKLSSALESYLEKIYELQQEYGAVRPTDLALEMGCKTPSVTSALQRLAKLGFINYETYRPVTLSPTGKEAAKKLNQNHSILANFFHNLLGISSEASDTEACKLEHQIAQQVVHRIGDFMAFLESTPNKEWEVKTLNMEFTIFLANKGKRK